VGKARVVVNKHGHFENNKALKNHPKESAHDSHQEREKSMTGSIDNDQEMRQHRADNYPPFFCVDPMLPPGIDGWNVQESNDPELDRITGELYADIAVRYAREQGNSGAIGFILATIIHKASTGRLVPGQIERGFFDRIAQIAYCGSMN
jgi:hypothetical protein